MTDWMDPFTPEEAEQVIERIASAIHRHRMETPAILFLEMHKPISFMASQGLIVGTPLIAPFAGLENVQTLSRLLRDRDNVERLIQRIEEFAVLGNASKEG